MAANFEQLGTPLDTKRSGEVIERGQTVVVDATTGKWKRAGVGEGTGMARQTHLALSTGINIYSSNFNGYRNRYRPSIDNVGECLAVDTGPFLVTQFDQFTGVVDEDDLLYCCGSGILGALASASGESGWATSKKIAVAKAQTAGSRVGGSGTDVINIVGLFTPGAPIA